MSRIFAAEVALVHPHDVAEVSSMDGVRAVRRPLLVVPAPVDALVREVRQRIWTADGVVLPGGGDLAAH